MRRIADRDLPVFLVRVVRVQIGHRQRVEKNRCGLLERNSVFMQVPCRFFRVPLVDHDGSLHEPLTQAERIRVREVPMDAASDESSPVPSERRESHSEAE